MITGKDIYEVVGAIVPLYVAMFLAYGSVRWWRIFSPEQCSGINRFVAVFAVPLLSFHFISTNNPYSMNYHFLAADSLQKLAVLAALFLWHRLSSAAAAASLDWAITLFSLSTLPNTLVMGIPLLRAMYGDFSASLMIQIVVLQSVVWYTLMLFLFEYRAAAALISEQFPPTIAGSIASFRVDSDVVSLSGHRDPLQADAEVGSDGRVHVVVRRSTAPSLAGGASSSSHNDHQHYRNRSLTPRASNLTGVEIYSLQSSREPTPRGSSFNQSEFFAMFSGGAATAGAGGLDEEVGMRFGRHRGAGSKSSDFMNGFSYGNQQPQNSVISGVAIGAGTPAKSTKNYPNSSKELHMYVWSASSASPASEANLRSALNRVASADLGALEPSKFAVPVPEFRGFRDPDVISLLIGLPVTGETASQIGKAEQWGSTEGGVGKSPAGGRIPASGSPAAAEKEKGGGLQVEGKQQMPPASVMTRLILIMVWRKLIRNPNTYSSLIGLLWSFVSFRWNIEMPTIIKGSISILSNAGLGMAMFSLGTCAFSLIS
ncbi:putative auxin efflux carrier component 2 [Apostasia shenzhenica]|uniref:Auxin efflux carrier component n=1 Tax=Apostasia shenzhenica TaxID=1088818 RepID=A0A2I0A5N0_9ASPA|nr:putative auxin efflux carrier component 2 [Apostasia shenzhenica]